MVAFSPFEIAMLVSFGLAWPFSIYRSWTSRCNHGKSIFFLWIIVAGYLMGTVHKLLYAYDWVMWLYIFNGLMVMVDIWIYFRNHRLELEDSTLPQAA